MSQNKRNLYEVMYIFNSALTEDALKKAFDKALDEMTSKGAEVKKVHDMGRRRLAYEIGRHREGHYFLVFLEAAPEILDEVKSEYRLMEDMVRYMILTADKVQEKLEFQPLAEE